MSTELVPIERPELPAIFTELADKARGYAENAKAANTRRAYATDWRGFVAWCDDKGITPLPAKPSAVLAFLTDHAGKLGTSTLQRKLSAIKDRHRQAGLDLDTSDVTFRDVWKGIRNTHRATPKKKAALVTAMLRRIIAELPDNLIGKRDRALLLIGFAAALRRSELASLEAAERNGAAGWIEDGEEGLTVRLAWSKTDQEGEGDTIGVPYGSSPDTCPVRAYRAWLEASGITGGPVFRAITRHGRMSADAVTDGAVARIVKRAITVASIAQGMTRDQAAEYAARFAGHSLRAGLATSAAANDAPGHLIQRQLRHSRFDTTAGYIRQGQLFKQNAAGMAGL